MSCHVAIAHFQATAQDDTPTPSHTRDVQVSSGAAGPPKSSFLCSANTHVKTLNYCLLPRDGHEQTSVLPDFSHTNRPIFVLFVKSEWVLYVLFCSSIFCLVACLRPLWASTELPHLTDHLSGLTVDSQPFSIDRHWGGFIFAVSGNAAASLFVRYVFGFVFPPTGCLLGVTESMGL